MKFFPVWTFRPKKKALMTTTNPDWAAATAAIDNAQRVLLVTHLNPDGDAIGSLLGLANALSVRGITYDMAVDGGVPEYLAYLPGAERVLPALTEGSWDVMVSLDSSDEARTGDCGVYGRANSRVVVNLDHHPTNTMFGQIFIVIPTAVAAAEIVHQWLIEMGQPVTPDVARPLLTGLITDTRGLRTSNVHAGTLGLAQALVEAGASLAEVALRVLDNRPYNDIELWKQAMPSVQMDGVVISANVTVDNLRAAGLDEVSDAGLVSMLLSVDTAMISVVFQETFENAVEISLRSKPGYDVSWVAVSCGGGGHRQAAGASIPGTLEDVRARVLPLLQQEAQRGELVIP